jgi:hypothetical protein
MPKISVYFEPRDIWIGIYWTRKTDTAKLMEEFYVYICILPMIPIRLVWQRDILRDLTR